MTKKHFIAYKPFGMLSQFTEEIPGQATLADLNADFPKDAYPVGRLDADSEGLLLLSNDPELNARLLQPSQKQEKTYWVQVEGVPDPKTIIQLQKGVEITIKGKKSRTAPAKVRILEAAPRLPDRNPPIRERRFIPTAWLEIAITEGKNRQIRRMCAAVHYPVLRLVRVGIAHFFYGKEPLGFLESGQVVEVNIPK